LIETGSFSRLLNQPFFYRCSLAGGCASRQPGTARLAEGKTSVQSFARSVAEEVTRQGPAAWRDFFEDSPSFFMAVDGRLQFPDGAAAKAAIPELTRTIQKIELEWGKDLRVDPLTEDLAVMGAPWHEILTLADGNRPDVSGTSFVENRDGHWRFRNVHWPTIQPASAPK
jgi:hypothetical protein